MSADAVTKAWIRNASDEMAVRKGCRFDVLRGGWTIWWIERYCRLYEGKHAGESLILRGCHECDHSSLEAIPGFDEELVIERAAVFAECVRAGHRIDWQYDCLMRLYGWIVHEDRFGVTDWWRRFKQASIWVAKKCKKSPTLAANAIYLECGDGEKGQKVFLGAKDGNQAREIAGKHAVEMLLQSPELMSECSLNKNLMRITHEESRSILQPLSSSNVRTQESKEGLNGSVLIDETHVVDRAFIERIDRAGISRTEPLHIEFSTAGDNPDSYGKERFDYACDVIAGRQSDQELFAAVYAAPQDLKDEDLAADPLKYGRMANPAFGHTVDESEFLKDYERSKRSASKLAKFKMYRLNIWQNTATPWIRADDWDACRDDFTENDLTGRECYAGLDLSRTRDTTSLQLVFPDDDGGYLLLSYFWLPEAMGRAQNHLASWLNWESQGLVHLIPGEVVEYQPIEDKFVELSEKFRIQSLAFDRTYAEDVTQRIEFRTGVERIEFGQGWRNFAGPTDEFERLVSCGKLKHNGNAVMSWQIKHAAVKSDNNANKRIIKPKPNDYRKVDGPVAAVMALALGIQANDTGGPCLTVVDASPAPKPWEEDDDEW